MGIVLSFINLKGGVGKTTCCFNMAGHLAWEDKKVLVIDLDPQGNLSTAFLGPARYYDEVLLIDDSKQKTVYQLFLDAINGTHVFDPEDAIRKAVIKGQRVSIPKLDLLPATHHLMRLERDIVNYDRTKFRILSDTLEKFEGDYDFILLDCPPNIYTATNNAMYASDYYVIPTIPDFLSITGIPLLVRILKRTAEIKNEEKGGLPILLGILVNLYDKRLGVHRQTVKTIHQMLEQFKQENLIDQTAVVIEPFIRYLTATKKALSENIPLTIHAPRSEAAGEVRECVHELLRLMGR